MKDRPNSLVEVRIAASQNDLHMVTAVRAAVLMAESAESSTATYADEFQANDFTCTHVLALVNGDPAGILRIRWFKDFAAMERIGIRARYRASYQIFMDLCDFSVQHIREKGYTTIVGRAFEKTWLMWARRIQAERSGPAIHFERGRLWPMVAHFPPLENSVSNLAFGDPAVEELIVQQEGKWDFGLVRHPEGSAA